MSLVQNSDELENVVPTIYKLSYLLDEYNATIKMGKCSEWTEEFYVYVDNECVDIFRNFIGQETIWNRHSDQIGSSKGKEFFDKFKEFVLKNHLFIHSSCDNIKIEEQYTDNVVIVKGRLLTYKTLIDEFS